MTILHYTLAWRHFEVINSTTGWSFTSLIDCRGNQPRDFGSMRVWSHFLVVQVSPNPFFAPGHFAAQVMADSESQFFFQNNRTSCVNFEQKHRHGYYISTSSFHNQRKKGPPNLRRISTLKNKEIVIQTLQQHCCAFICLLSAHWKFQSTCFMRPVFYLALYI